MTVDFNQTEQIRKRLQNKAERTPREKRVLRTGEARIPLKDKEKRQRRSNPNAIPQEKKEIFSVKLNAFIRELQKRPNVSKLYMYADELLAGVVFANANIIQEITELINSEKVRIRDPEESKALLQQLKGATAEVVNGLKALGVAGVNRPPEIRGDDAMQRLSEMDLTDHMPPELQEAYLAAQQDLARTEGGDAGFEAQEKKGEGSLSSVLSKLKQPIRAYTSSKDESDSESSPSPDERVHNPKTDGLVIS